MLNKNSIDEIYKKLDIPKYDKPLLEYNNGNWKWENKDFSRVPTLIEFRKMVDELKLSSEKMLVINGTGDPELEFIPTKEVKHGVYIHEPELYDLHTMDLDEKDYDFLMCNQTLEHVYNPFVALKTMNKHLRMGGYCYITVPCNNIPHDTPMHFYTGFTAVGLGTFFVEGGFEIIKLGQWGNYKAVETMFTDDWADYRKSSWNNEEKCPITSWCLGRKIEEV